MKSGFYKYGRGTFAGKDGYEIFFQSWTVDRPRILLVISHGLGEHSGRYMNLVNALEGKGVSVFAMDHRGHGRSAGKRGHVDDFMDYANDLRHFIAYVRDDMERVPLVLFGHSLGSVIACRYALEFPGDLQGLVMTGAGFHAGRDIPAFKRAIGSLLNGLAPRFCMSNAISPDMLTHDETAIDDYANDLLVHDRVSVRWFREFTAACRICLERAGEITVPLLLLHGADDRLAPPSGSEEFIQKASSQNRERRVYDGMYHEVLNETGRAAALETIAGWLSDIAAGKTGPKAKKASRPRKA